MPCPPCPSLTPAPRPLLFVRKGGRKGSVTKGGLRPLDSDPSSPPLSPALGLRAPCLPRPPKGSGGGARPTGVPRPLKRAGGRPRQASPPPSPPPATTPNPQPGGPGKRGGLRPGGRPLTVPGVCRGGRSGPGSARELVPGRGSMSRGRVDSRRRPAVSLLPGFSLSLRVSSSRRAAAPSLAVPGCECGPTVTRGCLIPGAYPLPQRGGIYDSPNSRAPRRGRREGIPPSRGGPVPGDQPGVLQEPH